MTRIKRTYFTCVSVDKKEINGMTESLYKDQLELK